MILTGKEIQKEVYNNNITISPFIPDHINPNSYNYRLGHTISVPEKQNRRVKFKKVVIPKDGFLMKPHTMYLGYTYEKLGSQRYAMSLIGRSSLGRLGLFVQISADLGHTGSNHNWTLEWVSVKPFILYAGMKIGQLSFWENQGSPKLYCAGYSVYNSEQTSKLIID